MAAGEAGIMYTCILLLTPYCVLDGNCVLDGGSSQVIID